MGLDRRLVVLLCYYNNKCDGHAAWRVVESNITVSDQSKCIWLVGDRVQQLNTEKKKPTFRQLGSTEIPKNSVLFAFPQVVPTFTALLWLSLAPALAHTMCQYTSNMGASHKNTTLLCGERQARHTLCPPFTSRAAISPASLPSVCVQSHR